MEGGEEMEKDMKATEKRNGELINLILDYAIKNHMSLKEIDDCMEEVSKIYYSDGLIIRD